MGKELEVDQLLINKIEFRYFVDLFSRAYGRVRLFKVTVPRVTVFLVIRCSSFKVHGRLLYKSASGYLGSQCYGLCSELA